MTAIKSKIEIKRSCYWLYFAICLFLFGMLGDYLEGRLNQFWIPPNLFSVLGLLVSGLVLFRYLVIAIKHRRHFKASYLLWLSVLLLFCLNLMVPRWKLTSYGFRNYTRSVLTPDEWRQIARAAQANLKPESQLPGPGKLFWDEKEDRVLWTKLCAETRLKKLPNYMVIFVSQDCTAITWGGALAGHRAVLIYTGNQQTTTNNFPDALNHLQVTEDIYTEITPG